MDDSAVHPKFWLTTKQCHNMWIALHKSMRRQTAQQQSDQRMWITIRKKNNNK